MTRSRAAFIFIFITVLLDMVSFGVIIPVFPQLILRLQGGDMAGAAAIFGPGTTTVAFFTRRAINLSILRSVTPAVMIPSFALDLPLAVVIVLVRSAGGTTLPASTVSFKLPLVAR